MPHSCCILLLVPLLSPCAAAVKTDNLPAGRLSEADLRVDYFTRFSILWHGVTVKKGVGLNDKCPRFVCRLGRSPQLQPLCRPSAIPGVECCTSRLRDRYPVRFTIYLDYLSYFLHLYFVYTLFLLLSYHTSYGINISKPSEA